MELNELINKLERIRKREWNIRVYAQFTLN